MLFQCRSSSHRWWWSLFSEVISSAFEGKGLLAKQRLVYGALTELMAEHAPVHAIDSLKTLVPNRPGFIWLEFSSDFGRCCLSALAQGLCSTSPLYSPINTLPPLQRQLTAF